MHLHILYYMLLYYYTTDTYYTSISIHFDPSRFGHPETILSCDQDVRVKSTLEVHLVVSSLCRWVASPVFANDFLGRTLGDFLLGFVGI